MRAELQGFSAAEAEDVQVTVNARLRVDLTLKVGNVGETVVVTGAATLLETESSDRGQVIGKEQIVNLPLNGRAYADLALLSPGVRRSAIADSRDASFNVNGLRSAVNSFILDGVDNNSYGTSNQGFSNQVVQLSPDAVEGVQGPDQQLQRRVRPHRRRGGQRLDAQRHQPVPRHRAGSSIATTRSTPTGFFKPSSGVQAEARIATSSASCSAGRSSATAPSSSPTTKGFRQISKTVTFATHPDRWRSARAFSAGRSSTR